VVASILLIISPIDDSEFFKQSNSVSRQKKREVDVFGWQASELEERRLSPREERLGIPSEVASVARKLSWQTRPCGVFLSHFG